MEEEQEKKLADAFRERTVGYITAAFSLVAGLAWNDAVKAFIDSVFPNSQNGVVAQFIYAIVVTIVAVMLTIYIVRLLKKEKE